jgi:hypothetical protein
MANGPYPIAVSRHPIVAMIVTLADAPSGPRRNVAKKLAASGRKSSECRPHAKVRIVTAMTAAMSMTAG